MTSMGAIHKLFYNHTLSPHQRYEDWLDIAQEGFLALQMCPLAVGNSLTLLVSLLATLMSQNLCAPCATTSICYFKRLFFC